MGYLALLAFYWLWALPFFSWLLVVSAYARSMPLVWAVGVPLGVIILERIFTRQTALADWISLHMIPLGFLDTDSPITENIASAVFSLQMVSAIVVGGALVFLATWLRSKADEI